MHNCEHLKNAYDLETSENENILKDWTKLKRCIALSKVLWDNKLHYIERKIKICNKTEPPA